MFETTGDGTQGPIFVTVVSGTAATRPTSNKQPRLLAPVIVNDMLRKNYLVRLPLEMLHEILSWTAPPDILALSRTSKYFCATLIPDRKLWRDARKRFRPYPIPDPAPDWTESAYIAFIFDGKPCEVCKRITYRMPFSYSLRARVCHNSACETEWRGKLTYIPGIGNDAANLPHIAAVQSWLPYHEGPPIQPGARGYIPSEWESAIQRHEWGIKIPENYAVVQQEFARKASRLPRIMKHAIRFNAWATAVEKWRKALNARNIKFLKDKATEEMWEIRDFVITPLYQSLRKHHNKVFEKITKKDFECVRAQFHHEVGKCGETRLRRIIENTARINRQDLRQYWNMLNTSSTRSLPPYSEFRRLNIIQALERKNTTETAALVVSTKLHSVRYELRTNRGTQEHIEQEMDNWLRDTRKKLAIKLGDPYPFLDAATGHIHTVDRTTAWFCCTRCNRVGKKHMEDQALTFANVCTHQCQGISKEARLECQWNLRYFEPDTKAIAAAKELLRVCALDERRVTKATLNAMGCRFLCKSCTNPIVMDASSVIGHSKRHDTIILELLSHDQAMATLPTPLERGLVWTLMGFSKSGEAARKKKSYACRHCNTKKPFTFDGFRSHMKARHHVVQVRDEDLLRIE